jgi:hypothetical protein
MPQLKKHLGKGCKMGVSRTKLFYQGKDKTHILKTKIPEPKEKHPLLCYLLGIGVVGWDLLAILLL